MDATREVRAKSGPVWVFDPQEICREQATWWWNPLSYVTDEVKAAKLADHFTAGSRDPGAKTDAFFDPAGQGLLAGCWPQRSTGIRSPSPAGLPLDHPAVGRRSAAAVQPVRLRQRWRDLPDLYSHYGSHGIVLMTILQSWSQGVDVWGESGMRKLWSASNVKVYGGGVADLAAMPKGRALVLASGARPTLVKTQPWMTGSHAAGVRASIANNDPQSDNTIREAEVSLASVMAAEKAAGGNGQGGIRMQEQR